MPKHCGMSCYKIYFLNTESKKKSTFIERFIYLSISFSEFYDSIVVLRRLAMTKYHDRFHPSISLLSRLSKIALWNFIFILIFILLTLAKLEIPYTHESPSLSHVEWDTKAERTPETRIATRWNTFSSACLVLK